MEDYVVIMAGEEEAELSSESGEGVSLDCSPCSEDRELTTSQNESSRLQEVTLYLSHLVGSYDTGTLTEACMGLAESIREADEGCLQLLCERDVVGVIVRLMEELPTHHDLQLILCDNLLQCSEQVGLRSGMDDHSVYRVVLAVLKRHRDRPELLGKALHVLASIAGTTFREDALREAMAYTSVLAVLRDYPEHTVVQSGGMMALTHLLKSDSYAAATVVLRDDHKFILNSLERHRDSATVVTSALNVLEVLCSNSNQGMVSLLNSSALRLAVEAIHMYGGDVEVVSSGCGVMDVLTEAAIKHPSAQFQSGMEQHQVTDLLVTKLQQYSGIIKIQTSALSALANLLLLLPLLSPPSINTYTWLCLIHSAFEAFSTDIRVQEVCCRCLARLMEKNPDLHHFIGRDSPKIQLPLHDSVWLVLLDQTKTADPRVFQSVVLALYYLVVDSEVLHRVLLEKGAAVAVLEGVREFLHDYSRDEVCVEYGCRALVALIMQNCSDAEKAYLYSLNILADIMTILEKFRFDPGVISEVFGVIACLANLSDFVEALGNNGVHRQILRSVREYSHHPVLVESGLEVMIILSQTNAMNQLLNEGDALECTAALMRHHINSPPIQRKGCLVIRLLCSTEYLTSQSVCTSLASAVVGALAQWRTEPAVEVEALVCIHKLSVSSEQMAGALVKRELHLLLFSMLYDWQEEGGSEGEGEEESGDKKRGAEGRGEGDGAESEETSAMSGQDSVENERDFVLRVGTDILFSLACVHDFKQEMLATAVKDGLLEGVRVLVEDIGADVNVGGGKETESTIQERRGEEQAVGTGDITPVCLAVHSRMKSMVELLLDLGATNIHAALKISRKLELDDITGVLLKSIALDRNGDSVNLSGLNLMTIKPQWILPCLGVNEMLRRRPSHRQRIKDLLMRRKSIGCIEDKNLELLRAKMESLIQDGPLTGGGGEGQGNDETDYENVTSSQQRLCHRRTHSGNVSFTPSEDKEQSVGSESFSSSPQVKVLESTRSKSTPPANQTDRLLDQVALSLSPQASSQGANPQVALSLSPQASSQGANPQECLSPFSSTPVKSRAPPRSSALFRPTLPPIHGTPVGSLSRFSRPPKLSHGEIVRGWVESSGELLDSSTSPLSPNGGQFITTEGAKRGEGGGGGREDTHETLVTSVDSGNTDVPLPRTPQRRHHSVLNSLMIQTGAQQNGVYPQRETTSPQQKHSFGEQSHLSPVPKKVGSVSPALLLRRFSMWRKKGQLRLRKCLSPFSRPGSPPARIYTDFTAQSSLSADSRDSTPIATESIAGAMFGHSHLSSDEGIWTATNNTRVAATHNCSKTSESSFHHSPASDFTDGGEGGGGGVFSPSGSMTPFGSFSHHLHSRRNYSSSLFSGTHTIHQWSDDVNTSSVSTVDAPGFASRMNDLRFRNRFAAGVEVREKITSARLVRVLDLSSNQLSGLEVMIGEGASDGRGEEDGEGGEIVLRRLRGLCRLDLKQNQLCRLPYVLMKEIKKLSILNLSRNVFEELPAESVLSPALTTLDLSANKISHIPDLPTLPNLSKLLLANNELTEFPASINGTSLPHLKILSLRSNKIARLVDEDLRLKDLEELYLSKNSIQLVPDRFMASMLALKVLDVSHNQLELLPGDRAEDMVELTTLKVGYNVLGRKQAEFNSFITSAPVLRTVDATENELSLLPPPYVWRSCGLKDLHLNVNAITQLDLKECGRFWPHLESLYIGQNKITEIPKEIGELRALGCLDISHNDIRHLPDEIGNLNHLFLLNLQGLNKLSLDPSLMKGPTKSIISFLKSRRVKSVPCYQMKLMMVGGAGRGKTTLLHQLLQERVPGHARNNVATLGVNVKQWSYVIDGKTYQINCWDFAGQEEFYSTHQCFLTCRSIYLLVYDISKGESELSCLIPWLFNIQARAPSSPVIVIGTHIDKLNKDEYDSRRLQMRTRIQDLARRPGFPPNLSFSEVDCFNDKMLATLRKRVKEHINSAQLRGQKIMGGLVPHSYTVLTEVIQQEKKRLVKAKSRFPVLTAERLRNVMAASKLRMEKAELEQAVRFLHECGVLLHYPDAKSNLSQLFFLDPEWLCSLMAQIITVTEVNPLIDKQGLLQVRSLPHLLKEPKFPSEFMPEYVRLLERFEVVLSQTPHTLLIPSRLAKKKPSSLALPPASAGARIIRRYLFLYIPPGFWPRLVARLITFPKRTLPHYIKGNLEGKLEVWSEGIYYFWSEQAFFSVESHGGKSNVLDIVVPTTMVGTKLLCSVVDNIEHLIDEWFPGLRDIDTTSGRDLVCPMALCPRCPISADPHCFHLSDLQQASTNSDHITCPRHGGKVVLEQLAPDVVISDLDSQFKVLPSDFSIEESSANLLGSGGFGAVYKAMYRCRPVAVKVFSEKTAKINNTTPNHLLRLEVSILSQLEHPNVISLVGVCMRPKPMMLLEYAELGSLRSLYPYDHLSNMIKHRIALQVASALAYLHKHNIIYRDLKADNVLIFSLSVVTKVNAKLSDYGIACTATETGLTQAIGTRGCKAPELLKAPSSYATYNEKVDVYSYGLLMFTVMSNGHKPHEELTDPYERDKAIEEGRPIKDLEQYGCPPWPDMQDLVTHCLHYLPLQRPSAQEIFDRLCAPEFICLKRAIQMAYDCNLETITVRTFRDKQEGSKSVEVWMASTLEQQTMLSIMNLSERNATPKGFMIPMAKVYSMVAVQTSHVLLGTELGHIMVYDGYSRKKSHQFAALHDAVLCLQFFKCSSLGSYALYAGLASGQLAIYDEYLIPCADAKPSTVLQLGTGPIRSVCQLRDRLYVSCGQEIVVVRVSQHTVETRWRAAEDPKSFVTCVEVSPDTVWSVQNRSPTIQLWDIEDGHKHRGEVNCDTILRTLLPQSSPINSRGSRVTSMFLQPHPHSVMWVGLGSGHLLLISVPSRNPLMVVHRHVDAIRSLQCQKVPVSGKPAHLILSAGFGFRQRPGALSTHKGMPETYGNLLVWDAIMPRMKTTFDDMRRQQDLYR